MSYTPAELSILIYYIRIALNNIIPDNTTGYYDLACFTICPASGITICPTASSTAFGEPGRQNTAQPCIIPAVALLNIVADPI
jgi:hypothetical protein